MTDVAGASRYIGAARLANGQGLSPYTASLLDGGLGAQSLLDSGRRINRSGIGISSNSRALTESFLGNSGNYNKLLSLGVGASLSIEGLKTQILAIRARTPTDQLASDLVQFATDDGSAAASTNGQAVDTEA